MNASAMNSESLDMDRRQILDDITQTIFAVSDNIPPSQKIEMGTLLLADLGLESIEIANLFRQCSSISWLRSSSDAAGSSEAAVPVPWQIRYW